MIACKAACCALVGRLFGFMHGVRVCMLMCVRMCAHARVGLEKVQRTELKVDSAWRMVTRGL